MPAAQIVPATAQNITAAAQHLREGRLVAFPTETVYGLGADARSAEALQRMFAAKQRPADHPVIVHIGDVSHLDQWAAEIPDTALRLAEALWPGPLTLILKRAPEVIDAITGGQTTIGIRIPSHPVALALLREFGGGIAAPSANRFGQISPTRAEHVAEGLGDRVSLIVDGGSCIVGIESSIVDLSGMRPRLLRPGMLGRAEIEALLGSEFDHDTSSGPRVSGSLASHYAPETPAFGLGKDELRAALFEPGAGGKTGVIATGKQPSDVPATSVWRDLSSDPAAYAHSFYAALRELDALNLTRILLELPPETVEWEAVRDRIQRASACPVSREATR